MRDAQHITAQLTSKSGCMYMHIYIYMYASDALIRLCLLRDAHHSSIDVQVGMYEVLTRQVRDRHAVKAASHPPSLTCSIRMRQHTHTSAYAYVSIRQHASAYRIKAASHPPSLNCSLACVSIRMRQRTAALKQARMRHFSACACVSIHQL